MTTKIRVGVFMGGKSVEHEVSFNSGRTVCDHLDTQMYEIIPIYQTQNGKLFVLPWHFLHRGKTADFIHRLEREATEIAWDDLPELIDFAFLALHGPFAEDGTIQGFLEILAIPYLGSDIFASALCMDKSIQKNFLLYHDIDVPHGIVATPQMIVQWQENEQELHELLQQHNLQPPFIVKPRSEGSSLGVFVAHEVKDLPRILYASASICSEKMQDVLIEEKLSGMEFSCIVLYDYHKKRWYALPPTEIAQENPDAIFDYKQKYMPGQACEFTPPRCTIKQISDIQKISVHVTELLGVSTFSRIDGYLTTDGRLVIFECNTLSGMGPTSLLFREGAEIGMSHTDLINHLIKTDLHKYGLLTIEKETMQSSESVNQQTKKIRVAVLMGGATNEREISFESGRNVLYKLSPHKYEALPLFVDDAMKLYHINQSLLVRSSTHEVASLVTSDMQVKWSDLPKIADFVFITLHGGAGENGAVQGTLEMLELPYNGSSILTSSLCINKYRTAEFLRNNNIAVPRSMLIETNEWLIDQNTCIAKICTSFTFPFIIKPHDDGCSVMVQKIKSQENVITVMQAMIQNKKTHVMIEEFIDGTELTIGVIGNEKAKALPPSQVILTGDILSIEEKFLPGAGENQTPALLSAHAIAFAQKEVERTYELADCKGYARIDCFYQSTEQSPTQSERLVILEINTLPGLTPATCIFHQAAEIGIKPMDFIDMIVTLGFEKHTDKKINAETESTIIKHDVQIEDQL